MSMGIIKARHQNSVLAIVFLAKILSRLLFPNIFDNVFFDTDVHVFFNFKIFI